MPRSRRYIKKLAERVSEHRRQKPERTVEVWAFDEQRVGLKPILRRQWAPKGQRPTAVVQHRFEWLYLDGFVHPSTGEVVWFICNAVGIDLFAAVLAAFAQTVGAETVGAETVGAETVGAGAGKLIILVLDNAGWHVSDKLIVPEGIELAFLPPYTPELQPAEHLWPLTNEAVANQHFATLKDLDAALGERCRTLAAMPEAIKARTHFGWWPAPGPIAPAPN